VGWTRTYYSPHVVIVSERPSLDVHILYRLYMQAETNVVSQVRHAASLTLSCIILNLRVGMCHKLKIPPPAFLKLNLNRHAFLKLNLNGHAFLNLNLNGHAFLKLSLNGHAFLKLNLNGHAFLKLNLNGHAVSERPSLDVHILYRLYMHFTVKGRIERPHRYAGHQID